ncbi:MAG: Fermentation-respiration switch protein FrsA, has esterase activity, DUF1100 family [Chloroflexi bacterium AL-W]|nr:Fermentation-respiration switch protein FrsA, has esterase activity, DUF1100 family [Chloroflexi bacterium AL-N1]NOK70455.1 Fermentation-respiration switch protein FrsA, has esterase activity, DUF1100 family [Chloroflexi bacterium AL-N10]NOK78186.1 Fermentation-respiration switch protein FrsA, has esterase activity, DUF1100 family [Chloroflexi bacterium AL-N5]NOK85285.1 Fermentation-respiration switch protein FrsA, has esterase activity, DUF1100 family [Chloroflexi bacterium AL-W]NOK92050.1 
MIAQATRFIEQLVDGDYVTAPEQFDSDLLDAAPPDQLEAIWDDIIAQNGAFKRIADTRVESDDQYTRVILTCEFEQN